MKLRIAILSAAHGHAASYAAALAHHPEAELVGVWDSHPTRAEAFAAQFSIPALASLERLLNTNIDGVVITSENIHHRTLTEQAARAGVGAILCEKPLATTKADAQAMLDLCLAQNVRLATAFPCRYAPVLMRGRTLIQSGAIGEILAIRGTNRGTNPGGWFTDKALAGGGAVLDHAVHVADLNRLLLGQDAATVWAQIGNGFRGEPIDDMGLLSITYEGGAFATLDTSWSRPKTFPTWGDVTLQIVGTEGVLDLDLFAQTLAHYDDRANQVTWPFWGADMNAAMMGDFLRLAGGEPAPLLATGLDGLRALEVALAAYGSARENRVVRVSEV